MHHVAFVTDPDGNDFELARDREPQDWPAYDNPEFIDAPMDVDALLAQL